MAQRKKETAKVSRKKKSTIKSLDVPTDLPVQPAKVSRRKKATAKSVNLPVQPVSVLPSVSIFTPTHNTSKLLDAYNSIKDQPFDQWVILYNNGAVPLGISAGDPRVLEVVDSKPSTDDDASFVGRLKKLACSYCTCDILLELDHDDLLLPTAVEKVKAAFLDPEIGFVYSNTLHVTDDLKHSSARFDASFGWQYRQVPFNGVMVDECVSFSPIPSAVSLIWYAPDHLRAFRHSVYNAIGGYNCGMRVLDDQDIVCRMYLVTKFKHLDEPLYAYRYGDNTFAQAGTFDHIQQRTQELRDIYLQALVEKWSKDQGLRLVEVGGRMNASPGYETVDLVDADIIGDLNERWPFEDNSVGVLRSFDVFEHLSSITHTMSELHRVLAPGGMAYIQVPSTDGRGAFQAPDHVSFWNNNSFFYWTQERYQKYLPNISMPIRFQILKCYTTSKDPDEVCWTRAIIMKLGTERVPSRVMI